MMVSVCCTVYMGCANLNGMLPSTTAGAAPVYATLLTPKGKFLHDAIFHQDKGVCVYVCVCVRMCLYTCVDVGVNSGVERRAFMMMYMPLHGVCLFACVCAFLVFTVPDE